MRDRLSLNVSVFTDGAEDGAVFIAAQASQGRPPLQIEGLQEAFGLGATTGLKERVFAAATVWAVSTRDSEGNGCSVPVETPRLEV